MKNFILLIFGGRPCSRPGTTYSYPSRSRSAIAKGALP